MFDNIQRGWYNITFWKTPSTSMKHYLTCCHSSLLTTIDLGRKKESIFVYIMWNIECWSVFLLHSLPLVSSRVLVQLLTQSDTRPPKTSSNIFIRDMLTRDIPKGYQQKHKKAYCTTGKIPLPNNGNWIQKFAKFCLLSLPTNNLQVTNAKEKAIHLQRVYCTFENGFTCTLLCWTFCVPERA